MLLPLAIFVPADAIPQPACRTAGAADLAHIRIVRIEDETYEAAQPAIARRYGLSPIRGLVVRFAWKAASRECLRLSWRLVPFGDHPATAADFGNRASGSLLLAATPDPQDAGAPRPELEIRPIDDGITEPNETARLELLDGSGRVIWGDIAPRPRRVAGLVLWDNQEFDPPGLVFTVHDVPRSCEMPGHGSGFRPTLTSYAGKLWLGIARPGDRAILRCARIPWRIMPSQAVPSTHFAGRRYPAGVAYFSSVASGGPDDAETISIALPIKSPRSLRGRRLRVEWGSDRPSRSTDLIIP